jgi:hypothetical protein
MLLIFCAQEAAYFLHMLTVLAEFLGIPTLIFCCLTYGADRYTAHPHIAEQGLSVSLLLLMLHGVRSNIHCTMLWKPICRRML